MGYFNVTLVGVIKRNRVVDLTGSLGGLLADRLRGSVVGIGGAVQELGCPSGGIFFEVPDTLEVSDGAAACIPGAGDVLLICRRCIPIVHVQSGVFGGRDSRNFYP